MQMRAALAARAVRGGRPFDVGVAGRRQPRGPDHHADAAGQGLQRAPLDRIGGREVHQHVGGTCSCPAVAATMAGGSFSSADVTTRLPLSRSSS